MILITFDDDDDDDDDDDNDTDTNDSLKKFFKKLIIPGRL